LISQSRGLGDVYKRQKLTPIWSVALSSIVSTALDGNKEAKLIVKQMDGVSAERSLSFSEDDSKSPEDLYQNLGLKPWTPKLKPIIGNILPDNAALAAGLQKGDLVVSADGVSVSDWMQWVEIVKKRPERSIQLVVERDGVQLPMSITPKKVQLEQGAEGKIGASVYVPEDLQKSMQVNYSLSVLDAIPDAIKTTVTYSLSTVKMLGKMFVGEAAVENLSGPISIAQYAGQSASIGVVAFLKFMAVVSVSLGVLNLLPVPVLDGGHLIFFGIEGLLGKPVPEKIQLFFQQVGMTLLLLLMAVAMFFDVQRLFH
jgi:regulator of sigma E protease